VLQVTAQVTRSYGWWAIQIPELPGVITQAKRLDQVSATVSDAVALILHVDPTEVEVRVQPLHDKAAQKRLREAHRRTRSQGCPG